MRFRGRRDELERRLQEERPQPHDDFVSRLTGRLTPTPVRRRGWSAGLALGFTTVLVVAFAATGGISYAGSAVKGGTHAVSHLVTGHSNGNAGNGNSGNNGNQNGNDPGGTSGSQGDHKQTICHIPPGNPDNPQTIVVDDSAVQTHLDHGDSLGPCPESGGPPDDQYGEKVLICHIPPGNPGNEHTISVSVNAVPAHLGHGDHLGPC